MSRGIDHRIKRATDGRRSASGGFTSWGVDAVAGEIAYYRRGSTQMCYRSDFDHLSDLQLEELEAAYKRVTGKNLFGAP